MSELHRIVLTGGPSGGKSSTVRALNEHFPTDVHCVPEVATMLLSGGFPAPDETHPWTQNWQDDFQKAIVHTQLAVESIELDRARDEHKRTVVFDRGLLDAAAYLVGGVSTLDLWLGRPREILYSRYDRVIHLPTSAHQAYDKDSNPHRFEDAEAAVRLDRTLEAIWKPHPGWMLHDQPTKEARVRATVELVGRLLSHESSGE